MKFTTTTTTTVTVGACHSAATASHGKTRRLQKVPDRISRRFFGQSIGNFLLYQANIFPSEKDPLFAQNDRGPATIGECVARRGDHCDTAVTVKIDASTVIQTRISQRNYSLFRRFEVLPISPGDELSVGIFSRFLSPSVFAGKFGEVGDPGPARRQLAGAETAEISPFGIFKKLVLQESLVDFYVPDVKMKLFSRAFQRYVSSHYPPVKCLRNSAFFLFRRHLGASAPKSVDTRGKPPT